MFSTIGNTLDFAGVSLMMKVSTLFLFLPSLLPPVKWLRRLQTVGTMLLLRLC